ncbi:Uncharacterised protein [Escherichia coli]|uniref:Uncharacterized protein n=1 Tax=Escherichia coli TaxID=562 RepID=A0A376RL68_ECOLX|nr:Uncharacterised protein [Escherichia coli]
MLSEQSWKIRFLGFKDLGRFKKAIDSNDLVPEQDLIEITAGNADEIISILPDNGHLYVKVKSNPKAPAEVNVTFSGIGGSFTAVFNQRSEDAGSWLQATGSRHNS